jgi:hypothetical protein
MFGSREGFKALLFLVRGDYLGRGALRLAVTPATA